MADTSRTAAGWWSADADDQSVAGGVDDLGGDPVDAVVQFHHPLGLFQKPSDQPEVARGGAVDRGDGLGSGGVGDVQAKVGDWRPRRVSSAGSSPTSIPMHAFQAEFKTLGQVSAPVQTALDRATQPEKDLTKVRQDKRRLKELVDTYAAVITELTDELIQAQQQRDEALAELARRHHDAVAVFADHRPTRRANDTFTR
ncbi:hypothetical protein [Nonomuraea sp. NPDC050786]|uniref:hypothetical protein n=1 Tax=Nonomuraea sp. NPDC050786 TaxID=3154840 RepID=UPI0034047A1C